MKKILGNIFTDNISDQKAKDKQKLLLGFTGAAFVLTLTFIIVFSEGKSGDIPFSLDDAKGKINISDATGGAKAEDRWIQLAEKKLQGVDDLYEQMQQLKDKNKKLEDMLAVVAVQDEEVGVLCIKHPSVTSSLYKPVPIRAIAEISFFYNLKTMLVTY
jgi:hypothetical protein